MNMQAMLKQAQNMQKKMQKEQEVIIYTTFIGTICLVKVTMNGDKKIEKVEIDSSFEKDDIEMLEDMIAIAVNDAMSQIDKVTESKLGKYTKGLPGLF